jgi:hypothetical protein
VQDELPAVDDPELGCTKDCQDPFSGHDPCDGAIKLLAAVCDNELERNNSMDGELKEDSDVINASQGPANAMSHSPHMTPAPAATVPQESAVAIYRQFAALAKSASTISESDDREMSEQAVEVANDKQEWEICDIIGKEDVDGVPRYWVQWSATLVPKSEMGKTRALVVRFEAGLRAQRK